MTVAGLLQVILFFILVFLCAKPLGWYIAIVYEREANQWGQWLYSIEKRIYRFCLISPEQEMGWKKYLTAMLSFNALGLFVVYAIARFQYYLPNNPQQFLGVPPDLSFNVAASFVTNTNWQAYAGESTMSYFTQMLGFTVQNFLSAASGLSLMAAVIRGLSRHESNTLGNFWVDTVRGILYILLPLALLFAVLLSSQGVIQNFKPYQKVESLQPRQPEEMTQQLLPMGPVASQVAIKQLGTNGGGFFNTNSAHPFENPTALSNLIEMVGILLIPAALCFTFGQMVKDKRQGWALFIAMTIMFVPLACALIMFEQSANPALAQLGVAPLPDAMGYPGGNMEGKESRFGIVNSALWAAAATATANGSVNAMHDSFMPLGGLVMLWFMHLGEVVFGGVGSGIYGMIMLVIMTVFVAGLMVGRSPEYLGKKIEPYEIKMASVAVLLVPLIIVVLTAAASVTKAGVSSLANPSAHGFSEILYAFTSLGNNNGSAFAGLNTNTFFYNLLGGVEMLMGRYWTAIPVLAVAGSLARKKIIPTSPGTLPTHTFLFILLLISVTFVLGALSFFPALALGPIVEHLMLWGQYGR